MHRAKPGDESSADTDALAFARFVLNNADAGSTDPENRVSPCPAYTYKRVWKSVQTQPEQRQAMKASEERRRAAQGGPTHGGEKSLRQRDTVVANSGGALPTDEGASAWQPWKVQSQAPFKLPPLPSKQSRRRKPAGAGGVKQGRRDHTRELSKSSMTPEPSLDLSPSNGEFNVTTRTAATAKRRLLPVTPRTYEYIRSQPTPETSEAVVEQLSRVVESSLKYDFDRRFGQTQKTAKEIAAERRAKTLVLLEALATGGPMPPPETLDGMRAGFDLLATGATVAAETLHAHMARAGLTPSKRWAGVRRGNFTFDALVQAVFVAPSPAASS